MLLRVTTAIVEPNMLIREGLTSLLERYSYRIVGSASGATDFIAQAPSESPKLILVGGETIKTALVEAKRCREFWPTSKIVLLLEAGSDEDFRQMMCSEIDGCVPRSVSQTTLMRTVDLVMLEDARLLVIIGQRQRSEAALDRMAAPVTVPQHPREGDGGSHKGNGLGHSGNGTALLASPRLAAVDAIVSPILPSGMVDAKPRVVPRLSERETQILDSIVRGYSNKLIARKCGITEATVKVHMKSILRKIQVVNRTQAAVWAMENGCAAHVEKRLLEAEAEDGAAA